MGVILFSLMTHENDYQRAQAAAAESMAKHLGAMIEIIYAENDPVYQSQQILNAIQKKNHNIEAIITEPVGTGMLQVAQAATKAGIAWCVLNREVDYISSLRAAPVPVFEVTVDQEEVGRLHAAQLAALLPNGGTVFYIEGPSSGTAAKLRSQALQKAKPANIDLKIIKGNWTEESAYKSVSSWLRLSTSKGAGFVAVVAQNDMMAVGARRAFLELPDTGERAHWSSLPFIGCDGLPDTGQQYVRRGTLAATVSYPLIAGIALEMYWQAKASGKLPPERRLVKPSSFPTLDALRPMNMSHHA